MTGDITGTGEEEYGRQERGKSGTTGKSGHLVPSEAPNASFGDGSGERVEDLDSPPVATITFGNKVIAELDESRQHNPSASEPGSTTEPDVTADRKIPGAGEGF